MHIEFLVEDRSGAGLLEIIVPKILGEAGRPHTWRIKGYKGVGKLPSGLKPNTDPAKRILLDNLPRLIAAYARTPGIDGIVVVLDADRRDCRSFLAELKSATARCPAGPFVLFRLAIEEIEAWYLGDREALLKAYPRAKPAVVGRYDQDSVCNTWELLADAVHPGRICRTEEGWRSHGRAGQTCLGTGDRAADGSGPKRLAELRQVP